MDLKLKVSSGLNWRYNLLRGPVGDNLCSFRVLYCEISTKYKNKTKSCIAELAVTKCRPWVAVPLNATVSQAHGGPGLG
jgi:hypothetical protein